MAKKKQSAKLAKSKEANRSSILLIPRCQSIFVVVQFTMHGLSIAVYYSVNLFPCNFLQFFVSLCFSSVSSSDSESAFLQRMYSQRIQRFIRTPEKERRLQHERPHDQ